MAAIANITIKKNDGTTDRVFTAKSGSAGDGLPARWRAEDTSLPVGWRTNASHISKDNGKGNARTHDVRFRFPVVRNLNGVDTLVGTIPFQMVGTCGEQFTQTEIDEAVSQALNFFGHASIRAAVKSGYADN